MDAVWEFSKTGNREQRLHFPINSCQVGLTRIKFMMGLADSKGYVGFDSDEPLLVFGMSQISR